ncbi:hypothetical protein GGR57DRAFT_502802 [Xylariaceae sp. FL1272]|nr:hypothetical protein GGR57DRAFT_502802 [Xylariaceae sp. FL1272]
MDATTAAAAAAITPINAAGRRATMAPIAITSTSTAADDGKAINQATALPTGTVTEDVGALSLAPLSLTPPSLSPSSLAGTDYYSDYYAGCGSETDSELGDDDDSDCESNFDSGYDSDIDSDLDRPATPTDDQDALAPAPIALQRETLERAYELIQDRTLISSDGLLVVSIAAIEKGDEKVLEEVAAIQAIYNQRRLALRRKAEEKK